MADKPLIEYPTLYTFKAIGLAGTDFADHVRKLVGKVVGPVAPDSCSSRESAGGKYESVSVNVHLQDEASRRAIYEALWEDDRVVFYL